MIRVLVDDLAFLPVDAVVRPANDLLEPVTPAGARMDQRAGAAFVQQRRVQSPLEVGAAVVTGAGELAAKFVLHVVIQGAGSAVGRDNVRRALTSAWQRAADWQLATVATPLVGAGAGGLSLEDSAILLAATIRQRSHPAPFPAELSIVVERNEDRKLIEAIIARTTS